MAFSSGVAVRIGSSRNPSAGLIRSPLAANRKNLG